MVYSPVAQIQPINGARPLYSPLMSLPIFSHAARAWGWSLVPISSMQHVCGGVHRDPLHVAHPPQFHVCGGIHRAGPPLLFARARNEAVEVEATEKVSQVGLKA